MMADIFKCEQACLERERGGVKLQPASSGEDVLATRLQPRCADGAVWVLVVAMCVARPSQQTWVKTLLAGLRRLVCPVQRHAKRQM